MNLIIDSGNTIIKAAVFEDDTLVFKQHIVYDDWQNDIKKILSSIYDGELEIKTLSKRIKKSIEYRKRNNTYLSSIPKYGLQYNKYLVNNNISRNVTKNNYEQLIITFINKLYWGSDMKSINYLLIFTFLTLIHINIGILQKIGI